MSETWTLDASERRTLWCLAAELEYACPIANRHLAGLAHGRLPSIDRLTRDKLVALHLALFTAKQLAPLPILHAESARVFARRKMLA